MFTEDLTVFFDTDDHAVSALYNSTTTIAVIFDHAYLEQLGIVAGADPVAMVITASVDADPTGKALVVNSVTYTIRNSRPLDDGALTLLDLEKAS